MRANQIISLLLGIILLANSGCIATHATLSKAKVEDHTDKDGKFTEQTVGKPGWLVLVPFAAIFDVATGPIQCVYLLFTFRDCQ